MLYCEVARGGPSQRGTAIPVNQIGRIVTECQKNNQELYRSLFALDPIITRHLEEHGTIRGYPGNYHIERVLFDVDGDIAQARELVGVLKTVLKGAGIQPFFSGRGWHITIPNVFHIEPGPTTPEELRETLAALIPDSLYDNIIDRGRIIRVANTVNHKTGLFKIPLLMEEFSVMSEDAIKEIATRPREFTYPSLANPNYSRFRKSIKTIPKTSPQADPLPKEDPTRMVPCMQKLYNRGPIVGRRHEDMMRMISAFRRQGVPRRAILAALGAWDTTMENGELTRMTNDVFDTPRQYGCQDVVMQEFCSKDCIFFKRQNFLMPMTHISSAERNYVEYVRNMTSTGRIDIGFIFGFGSFVVYPGEVVVLWADTGIGKSSFVQNILSNITLQTVYFSLENSEELVFRRFIQIHHGLTREQVIDHYTQNANTLSKGLEHILITTQRPDIQNIRKLMVDYNPQVIVIDVLDAVIGKGFNENDKVAEIITELKDIASNQRCIVIVVHHISKNAAVDTRTMERRLLTLHSGKGTSAVEQKADIVIGMDAVRGNDTMRLVRTLKGRDAKPFSVLMHYDAERTFRFSFVRNIKGEEV